MVMDVEPSYNVVAIVFDLLYGSDKSKYGLTIYKMVHISSKWWKYNFA